MKAITFVAFCLTVLGLKLSPAWRVLLMVAIDGVEPCELEGEERAIARQLFGDVDEIPEDARRTLVWRLGRGSGKTTIAAALGLWVMVTAPLSGIGPGMVPAVVTVAPGKGTAKLSVRVARELVRRVPALERLVADDGDTADGFSLVRPDGRRVAFVAVAASRGGVTVRGFDLLMIIFDESEFLSSNSEAAAGDGYVISDRDLYAAAKPRLHGPAVFISTPWPVENLTAELFERNHGNPTAALAALGVSTFMRPDDERLARDVQTEILRDEENARREYMCETGARGGSRLFDAASIEGAVVEGRPLVVFAPAGAIVGCGGDLGLERDSSAIATVANWDGAYQLLEFDEVRPTKTEPLEPGYVIRERFFPVMDRHGATSIMMDGHYRQSAVEHLEKAGREFARAPEGNQGKYDSYMFVRGLLRTGKLQIPAVPRLIAQLRAVTAKPLPGGLTRISSPRRVGQAHGDIVSALVLACWAAKESEATWLTAMRRLTERKVAQASVRVEAGTNVEGLPILHDPLHSANVAILDRTGKSITRFGFATSKEWMEAARRHLAEGPAREAPVDATRIVEGKLPDGRPRVVDPLQATTNWLVLTDDGEIASVSNTADAAWLRGVDRYLANRKASRA